MFEFFEKIAEGIGFKLIDNFSDKVAEYIKKPYRLYFFRGRMTKLNAIKQYFEKKASEENAKNKR